MPPELLVAGVVLIGLVIYSLTGGADFGGGVWDLLALGRRARLQREAIAHTIGPIWEANHVWLIVVLVLLWTCFPKVFATLGTALHIPLTLTLIGIVLRGSAFVFRSYDRQDTRSQLRWSLIFAGASVITPITFGISVGAISSGTLPMDPVTGMVQTDFISSWFAPFPLVVGLYTLTLFAWLAATYLTVEVGYAPLRRDFQYRAIAAGIASGVLAFAALLLMPTGAPHLWELVGSSPIVWVFVALVSSFAAVSLIAEWLRAFRIAQLTAGATVAMVVMGWGAAMFPEMVQPDLTVWNTAAPDTVQWTTLIVLGLGAVLLVPSFIWLYRVFDTARSAESKAAAEAKGTPPDEDPQRMSKA